MRVLPRRLRRTSSEDTSQRQEFDRQNSRVLASMELKRLTVARKDLPLDWDQVLRMLADPEGRRNYLE